MSRRYILQSLSRMANCDPISIYKRGYLPQRTQRYFSTNNVASSPSSTQKDTNYSTTPPSIKQDEFDHFNHLLNAHSQKQRDFIREFDNFHRDFFNQLPLRRYAFHDEFSKIDQIFNQEFNRIRKQFFEPSYQQRSATESENKQGQQKAPETNQQNSTASQTTKTKESEDNSTLRNTSSEDKPVTSRNNFVDFDSFFDSPKYISDIHKLFQEEQQKLQKMFEDLETSFDKDYKESDPNVRRVRSYYKRTPEGEYEEYYDSKNPEKNYKIEKKFENPSLTSSENKVSSTSNTQQTKAQEAKDQQNLENLKADTTENNQEQTNTEQPAQQQTQTKEGTISISPELNEKAKRLSLMLKKEYLECLELARVYPKMSIGQIVDMVIEGESYNKQTN